MKKIIFCILLTLAVGTEYVSAQTIKTYSGGMKFPSDAYFLDEGESGTGSYQYYEKDGKRVKHGSFKFTNNGNYIAGQFSHGRKQGVWIYRKTWRHTRKAYTGTNVIKGFGNNIYIEHEHVGAKDWGESSECTITFKNDVPNGQYRYTEKHSENGITTSSYSGSAIMKDGKLSGTFTAYYSDNDDNITANCTVDNQGRANGTWTINQTYDNKKSKIKHEFCHGMLIKTSEYDDSTGEDEIIYKNKKYDAFKRLAKFGRDTLVYPRCMIEGDILYSKRYLKENEYPSFKGRYAIYACFEHVNFNQIFCNWEVYRTLKQIAEEKQRKLEEENKQLMLKKQHEEAARQAAEERKRIKLLKESNAPLLRQVARNDCSIDSMYYNKSSEFIAWAPQYAKKVIYGKYQYFCRELRKLDSCDMASIKDVLYIQDVVMKLRHMKTKKVEKQLKNGSYYTEESVRDFFRNDALRLAQ